MSKAKNKELTVEQKTEIYNALEMLDIVKEKYGVSTLAAFKAHYTMRKQNGLVNISTRSLAAKKAAKTKKLNAQKRSNAAVQAHVTRKEVAEIIENLLTLGKKAV